MKNKHDTFSSNDVQCPCLIAKRVYGLENTSTESVGLNHQHLSCQSVCVMY